MNQTEITIREVKELLASGKTVKVQSLGGEFTKIINYIEKGILKTYLVTLETGETIKCSAKHLFYANSGWIKTADLKPGVTKLMTVSTHFSTVKSVEYIGKYPIVDITVEHPEECYYGNGILNHNSGKSLMGAHLLAETQKKGGVAVFIDTESSVSPEFLQAIGVDIGKMLYVNVNTVEEVFDTIESIVSKVRKANNNRLVTILVDSVAAATTSKELATDHGQDGYATGKAIIISKAMRKITEMIARQRVCLVFTNQLRRKLGFVGFGDPWTTSGGKALAFHASVRIRLQGVGQIKVGDAVVGIKTKAKIIKNRMGPPMRSTEFNIFFDRGIDNYGNWLELLTEYDIVTPAKAEKEDKAEVKVKKTKKEIEEEKEANKKVKSLQFILEVVGKEPEVVKFEKKDFPKILTERPEVKDFLYQKLCDARVMKYRTTSDSLEDDIEVDTGGEGMGE